METPIIKGTCEHMCSKNEEELRIRERLLNFFEFKDGKKNVPGVLVSEFARSAAGMKRPKRFELRTESALQKTITYLLRNIVMDKRRPFSYVYDFIFDRLRSVRQEVVIQNFEVYPTVKILEPVVMFLAYSRYALCEEAIDNFDPKICDQHLQECLKRVLCCYDDLYLNGTTQEEISFKDEKIRIFMECLYLLFNLGSPEALHRTLKVPKNIKDAPLFRKVRGISLNFFCRNYFKAISEIQDLPHLLSAIASLKLQEIRRHILEMFSHAYNSKTLVVPLDWLSRILFQESAEIEKSLIYFNLEITCDKTSVKFSKTSFSAEKLPQKVYKERFVEEKIKKVYLPELLLLRKF